MTLLDTQALVWLAEGCNDLGEPARGLAFEAQRFDTQMNV